MAEAALEKFSADFLTERLRASGVLPCGRVIAVDAGERRSTIVSTIAPLRVEYSSGAPAEAPTRLFLKATRDGLDPGLLSVGEREVAFYRHAAPRMPGGPIPRCYDAEFIDGNFHLLLEDLSQTHTIVTPWPLPPIDEACERIIAARAIYARVHDARERLITPVRLYATYTIGHGDAHVWNLLYPRAGVTAAGILLIDWITGGSDVPPPISRT